MAGYDRSIYMEYLQRVPMFSACRRDELKEIADAASLRTFSEGEDVIVEGEAGDEFFVIGNGRASVLRKDSDVATLGDGDFFGELALFDPAPRNATVRAATALNVLVLSREGLRQVLDRLPSLRDAVLQGMARRLHELDARP